MKFLNVLNGYVNKQNCPICKDINPHECKNFWFDDVIDFYFFENDTGHVITLNGELYRSMIANFFYPELYALDINDK